MTFPKRCLAAAAVVLVAFVAFFYSWLAVASEPPPVEVAMMQEPIAAENFAVTPVPVQPATVVPVPQSRSDWEPYADQVFYALALALVGFIVHTVRPTILKAGDWLGQRAAAEELVKDDKMNALSKMLAVQALDFALGRLGYSRADLRDIRIRNMAFQMAADFAHAQWPEIWKWVDQNKDGQIDWFESHNATQIPPVDHALSKPASAAPAAA